MLLNIVAPVAVVLVALLICVACIVRMRSLRRKNYGKWRRVGEIIALSIVVLLAAAIGGGAAFNAVASQYFFSRHTAPGKLYDVGGYQMHLYCTGAGSPYVVLDAGLGNDSRSGPTCSPNFLRSRRCVPTIARDLVGARRGPSRGTPRHRRRIAWAAEAGGVKGPIILMGHSISGLYLRDYAARYPQNLLGLVFVDGSTPLQDARFPAEIQATEKQEFRCSAGGMAFGFGPGARHGRVRSGTGFGKRRGENGGGGWVPDFDADGFGAGIRSVRNLAKRRFIPGRLAICRS